MIKTKKGGEVVAFRRCFDVSKINNLSGESLELYRKLVCDIKSGDVFPAVRDDRLDFYHGGGVLFSFSGNSFKRNPNYDFYGNATETKKGNRTVAEKTYGKSFINNYEFFKECNRIRFSSNENEDSERKFLDNFYCDTYKGSSFPNLCVLDIEVRINEDGNKKKCDMVLLKSEADKSKIMFVEAKLYDNNEVKCAEGRIPEVVTQVEGYTEQLAKHKKTIEQQYINHLDIMSRLIFMKPYDKIDNIELISNAKLLIIGKPKDAVMTDNQKYSEQVLKERLDVLWVDTDVKLSDIWAGFTASK